MEEFTPEAVRVAAGFGAPREVTFRRHGLVVRAITAGDVLVAVPDIEDLKGRVGKRLAAGAPRTGDNGTIGKVLAHRRGPHGTG